MSFIDVNIRGRFRWPYDGFYQDDGTLTGQNQSMILVAPDGLTNASSACVPAPFFQNAIQCPAINGRFVRFGINEAPRYNHYYPYAPIYVFTPNTLLVFDKDGHSANVPWYAQELTTSNGYMMILRVNQTYKINYNRDSVS